MAGLNQPAQQLTRKRRDFDEIAHCFGKSGSEYRECMCRYGEDVLCEDDDWHEPINTAFQMVVIVVVISVLVLICTCVLCICRRRRNGIVFRTQSGRAMTTTTVVQQPPSQPAGAAVNRSYPTQPQTWAPPAQGGFPQPPAGYTPLQPQPGYPQPQPGLAPQPQPGYLQPQQGYPQPQTGYPQPQPGFAPQPQPGYPAQSQPGYPTPAPPASSAADLPPPYDAATGYQPPFNPNFQEGDTKRPL